MTTTSSLDGERRRAALAALLERDGAIRLETAAAELDVSAMTIRRDLVDMEASGLLRRVRGGALPPLGPRSFSDRSSTRGRAKAMIAEKALRLVPTSGAIALDASSTVGRLGARAGTRDGLLVATNSWDNFAVVRQGGAAKPVLVGGEPDELTDSFVGAIACRAASSMLYRRFFTSASAVDPVHGSSEVSLSEAQIKHEFARAARETVLCVDSTKLGQQDVALCFRLDEIGLLVTELDPDHELLEPYRGLVEIL